MNVTSSSGGRKSSGWQNVTARSLWLRAQMLATDVQCKCKDVMKTCARWTRLKYTHRNVWAKKGLCHTYTQPPHPPSDPFLFFRRNMASIVNIFFSWAHVCLYMCVHTGISIKIVFLIHMETVRCSLIFSTRSMLNVSTYRSSILIQ